jgi:hypothetical protein
MSNSTPLHAVAGRSPEHAASKPRGKAAKSYITKAKFFQMADMARAAGIVPTCVTFGPDGTLTFSEGSVVPSGPPDVFAKWKDQL